MAETTIHFVETMTQEQPMAVCQTVAYFYEQGKRIQVVAGSSLAAQRLDALLWTFAQASFIPHRIGLPVQGDKALEPVIITIAETAVAGARVLVCEGLVRLEFMQRYDDAVHFVLMDDPEQRQESRSLWQAARDKGIRTSHVAYASKGKALASAVKSGA